MNALWIHIVISYVAIQHGTIYTSHVWMDTWWTFLQKFWDIVNFTSSVGYMWFICSNLRGVLTWEGYWAQSCVVRSLSTLRLVWTQFISPQVKRRVCLKCKNFSIIWFKILFYHMLSFFESTIFFFTYRDKCEIDEKLQSPQGFVF